VPATAQTGTPLVVTVSGLDAYGNATPSYTGKVHFSSSDANAVLPADANLASGVGSFNVTLKTSGSQTLTAADTSNTTLRGTSAAILATGLTVTSFTPTLTGFRATFSKPFNPAVINLYDAAAAGFGPVDVSLTGPAGLVKGTLLL